VTKPTTPAELRALAATCEARTGRQVEFAAFVGWDKSHVTRLKQQGYLVLVSGGAVDFAASLRRIAENADPERDAQREAAAARRVTTNVAPPTPSADAPDDETDEEPAANTPTYAAWRADEKRWDAVKRRMEVKQAAKELVLVKRLDGPLADQLTRIRQRLESIEYRLADRLVGKTLDEIRNLLREEMEATLEDLHGQIKRVLHAAKAAAGPEDPDDEEAWT
jgi:hypothetical protein